jgi:hypothetical protein
MPIGLAMAAIGGNRRRERIYFETDRHAVIGDMTLPFEGYQSRFSDAINRPEIAFVPLTNVEIAPLGGQEAPEKREFVVLAKSQIRLAYPLDES